jgi:hypothetical protein
MRRRSETIPPERDRWMPRNGEQYFLIMGNRTVQRFQWHGTEFDLDAWKFGNCFKTSQDAERAREVVKVLLNYLRIEYER